ncbi:unnamed protein product [Ectocarpus sp. 12 AP-2014]
MNPLGYAPPRRICLKGMILLVVIFAGSLTVVSTATASSISAQTTSGNDGLSSGKACDPGDANCLGDETDDSNFYTFTYICHILWLFMILQASWVAAVWVAGTVAAAVGWARERGLMARPGRLIFEVMVVWP